jgi:hypothetical protein
MHEPPKTEEQLHEMTQMIDWAEGDNIPYAQLVPAALNLVVTGNSLQVDAFT